MPGPSRQKPSRPRKTPRQARSQQMNADLLAGASRVLQQDGADNFTTHRVADATGVSIGSLYQYHPNKASLLLQLHHRDAELAWHELAALLDDTTRPARDRLTDFVHRFIALQGAAQEHHRALQTADIVISATPEFAALERRAVTHFHRFLAAALPHGDDHEFDARYLVTVLTAIGERLATHALPPFERESFATATAHMLCSHLGL